MSEKCIYPFCGCTQMQGELGKEVLHCDKTPIPEHWRINPFFKARLPSKEYSNSRETIERQAREIDALTNAIKAQQEEIAGLRQDIYILTGDDPGMLGQIFSRRVYAAVNSRIDEQVKQIKEVQARDKEIDRLHKRLQQAEFQAKIADFKQESPMWQEFLESIIKARFLLLEEWIKDLKNQIAALKATHK